MQITDSYTFEEWLRLWRDNVRRAIQFQREARKLTDTAGMQGLKS